MAATRRRLLGLQHENAKLHQKIEDIRLVDRAKCTLIQYLNLSEPQAHRYIGKNKRWTDGLAKGKWRKVF